MPTTTEKYKLICKIKGVDYQITRKKRSGIKVTTDDIELLVNEIMTELFSKDWQQTLNEEGAHAESANLLYRSFNALTPKDLVSEHKKLVVDKHVSRRTSGEKPPLGADEKAELLNNIKESFRSKR